jgi:hypothetical protein
MPNAMDYDALAKMYASEQDPRQLTMNDALQNYSRQQKIEALIAEARAQQQWNNQQEELKNAAHIRQSNALADNYARDKTNQWQADQAAQGLWNRVHVPRIAAYHSTGETNKILEDKTIPQEFKDSMILVPPEKRDAWLEKYLGFSPRDKTVAGLQTTDKKVAGNKEIASGHDATSITVAKIRAAAKAAGGGTKAATVKEDQVLRELERKMADKSITLAEQEFYNNITNRRKAEKAASAMANPNQTRPLIDPSSIGIKTTTPLQERSKIEGTNKPALPAGWTMK